ncbi:MAG: hypothetical protein ABI656_10700 [bacterium]
MHLVQYAGADWLLDKLICFDNTATFCGRFRNIANGQKPIARGADRDCVPRHQDGYTGAVDRAAVSVIAVD